MSHPWIHAISSAKQFGGKTEDYIALHSWFDDTKAWCPDWRHRAIRHHSKGIEECVTVFGDTIVNSDGTQVSVYELGVQHVTEDVGFVPTPKDWTEHFSVDLWKAFQESEVTKRQLLQKTMQSRVPESVRDYIKQER
jgi:hypothetical protein